MSRTIAPTTKSRAVAADRGATDLSARRVMQRLLDVDIDRQRWVSLHQAVRTTILSEDSWRDPARHLDEAHKVVRGIRASILDLEQAEEMLRELNAEDCKDQQLDGLLSFLIDGYPNARPANLTGYIDGLFLSIQQENRRASVEAGAGRPLLISAPALAAAIKKAWREHKFPPSPAEMLTLCVEARQQFGSTVFALRRLQDVLAFAESVLIVSGELTDYSDGCGDGPKLLAQFKGLH